MEIALGGSTHASSAFTASTSGTALVVNGTINGTLAANSSTTISGSGTVVGAATVSGNLNPGNRPGELNFSSSLAMANSTVTTMEINGTTLGLNYDNIDVGTDLTYDGALTLALGTTFGSSAVFDLFEFGSQTVPLIRISNRKLRQRFPNQPERRVGSDHQQWQRDVVVLANHRRSYPDRHPRTPRRPTRRSWSPHAPPPSPVKL